MVSMISHKLYYTGQLGRILGASGGHFAAEKLSGVAHSVLCSVHILFRNSFQVVSPTLLDYTGTIETCFYAGLNCTNFTTGGYWVVFWGRLAGTLQQKNVVALVNMCFVVFRYSFEIHFK